MAIEMRIKIPFLLTAVCVSLSVNSLAESKNEKTIRDQALPTENTAALKTGVPPRMPRNAKRSGYCCMLIDVDDAGEPENVRTSYCSASYFVRPSVKAARKWKFNPAMKDGVPVRAYNQKFTNTFVLKNSRGQIVQDKEKIFVTRTGFNKNYEDLCGSQLIS